MKNNLITFISCEEEYDESNIVIFGAPFDGTTSFRPGTRFAPNAIRLDSDGLETYSPYLDVDISDKKISDIGDVEIQFGNTQKVINDIYEQSNIIINDNKKPLMIGGEHLVTYPQVKALVNKFEDLHIIHLDAHADLRDDYLGEKFSHATVMRRCYDMVGKDRIFQFGIRSGTKEEFSFQNCNTYMEKFNIETFASVKEKLVGKNVYLTIDLDVLDPSIFSGTGTPEPGGITFKELMNFFKEISTLKLVGADVVELSPQYDTTGVSNAVAAKVIREVLCLL